MLTEGWERVQWARTQWQRRTLGAPGSAEEAAVALNMKPGTYRAYERPPGASKHTGLTARSAEKFGRAFGVSWIWLLKNEGTPFGALPAQIARVVHAMTAMSEDQQKAIADMIEALDRKTGTYG